MESWKWEALLPIPLCSLSRVAFHPSSSTPMAPCQISEDVTLLGESLPETEFWISKESIFITSPLCYHFHLGAQHLNGKSPPPPLSFCFRFLPQERLVAGVSGHISHLSIYSNLQQIPALQTYISRVYTPMITGPSCTVNKVAVNFVQVRRCLAV